MRPLPAKPNVQGGPKPTRDWPAIAAELRANPGTWYEVALYQFQTNEAHRIKTGANPAFREGTWDAMRESTPDGYVLYACYLGEDEPEMCGVADAKGRPCGLDAGHGGPHREVGR